MSENGFDPKAFLTKDTFTIPVELPDTDEEGKPINHTMVITYQFGADQEDIFAKQEGVTVSDQLAALVQKIKGMDEKPTKEFWELAGKRRPRHVIAIAQAILSDVFPNVSTTPEA
jgi:hypothetical protein